MPRRAKTGNVRMKQLGRVKIEVWLSEGQKKAFAKLAQELHLPVATLARRAMNYASGGGYPAMRCLQSDALD